jgi:uncharacterized membrane protein
METLTEIFSYLCGAGRRFVIDGAALPLCQRCLGLYVGAALTGVWLVGSGIRRRGLPTWSVFAANVIVLLAAMLGGLHVIDGGATWRLICGYWTGHVVTLWLLGGAVQLQTLTGGAQQSPWRTRDKLQGVAAPVLLLILAMSFDSLAVLGWFLWASLAGAGAVVLAGVSILSVISVLRFALRTLPPRASRGAPAG